ncbi:hypothetical protein GGI22_003197 [Coemansia erecta]|nr:hypothetical protein GGI22_003197 [Coemansia erecta]
MHTCCCNGSTALPPTTFVAVLGATKRLTPVMRDRRLYSPRRSSFRPLDECKSRGAYMKKCMLPCESAARICICWPYTTRSVYSTGSLL